MTEPVIGSVVCVSAVDWCRHQYQMSRDDAQKATLKAGKIYGVLVRFDDEAVGITTQTFDDGDCRDAVVIPRCCVKAIETYALPQEPAP